MSSLKVYAQHGSTSYGELSAFRFLEIIKGEQPTGDEMPRLQKAFMEMPASKAHDLAAEIGMRHSELEARVIALLRKAARMRGEAPRWRELL